MHFSHRGWSGNGSGMEKIPPPDLPSTMHAMAIAEGELEAVMLPTPVPASGELVIRVAYVGVNRADILQIEGHYAAPAGASPLPGLEVSGWVAAIGEGVHSFTIGDRVCALLSGGGYAEYVNAPEGHVLKLPPSIGLKIAASLPEAAATSLMALVHEGGLRAGERVLIHGGTSGVGLLMTQIAKHLGAEVYTSVGGATKADFMRNLGITAIDHTLSPFAEQLLALTQNEGVDLIIDTLGGPQLPNHLRLLRRGGRLISLAMLEGSDIPAATKMTRLVMNHLSWRGATLRSRSLAEKAALMALVREHVWPAIENGTITPHIDSCFALVEAKKALARMQERLHMGKILLEVAPE